MNIIFAIFNDAYSKVRRNYVHTLMYYKTIWDGFEVFVQNNVNWIIDLFTKVKETPEKEINK